MKKNEIQELIRVYAEQKELSCKAAKELFEKILKIVLPDFRDGDAENKSLGNRGGKENENKKIFICRTGGRSRGDGAVRMRKQS